MRTKNNDTTSAKRQKQEVAEIMFVEGGYSQKDIAEFLKVTPHTVGNWNEKMGWDAKRNTLMLTSQNLIRDLYEQAALITATAKESGKPIGTKEADTLAKIAAAIEKVDKKINPHIIMSVFMEFNEFVKTIDLPFAKKMIEFEKIYLQHRTSYASKR